MALTCLAVMSGFAYYYFFSAFSVSSTTEYLYIDQDDNIDSVFTKLTPIASRHGMQGLSTLVRHSDYPELIKTGRYEITTSIGAFQLFRSLKSGMQSPVHLTVPSVRTVEDLAEELTTKLMLDSATLHAALVNPDTCKTYGYTPETITCMFVPNTYEVYWNISLSKLLKRMKKESDSFWNEDRMAKAQRETNTHRGYHPCKYSRRRDRQQCREAHGGRYVLQSPDDARWRIPKWHAAAGRPYYQIRA